MAVKRIFRYIFGTKTLGIKFKQSDVFNLTGYSDSDWAGDVKDRKSTSGFVFMLGGGPISWRSRKQTIVAVSTCEAEYISMSSTCKEGVWLRSLVKDMVHDIKDLNTIMEKPLKILSDNQGAIALAQNESINNRTKHIDIAYHYVRDVVLQGIVELEYVPTTNMVADMFTKSLPRVSFERNVVSLGLKSKGESEAI